MKTTTSVERAKIVLDQAEIMLALIEQNKDKTNLKDIILNHPFPDARSLKPDAIKLVIDYLNKKNFSPNIIKAANEVLIERNIGKVKHNVNFEEVGGKTEGQAAGGVVKKSHKSSSIMQKSGQIQDIFNEETETSIPTIVDTPGADALEYIGSQLANVIMPDASPKVKLHKDEKGKVTLLSTFLKDFKPIGKVEITDTGKQTLNISKKFKGIQEKPKGIGNFFAANFLLGDHDLGFSNTDEDLRRIDFGQSLGQHFSHPNAFKKHLLTSFNDIYTEEMLSGANFANEILELTKTIDINQIKHSVQLSLQNLKEAYGNKFLDNPSVAQDFRNRLKLDSKIELTPELIEGTIVNNIIKKKKSLEEMAESELRIAKHLETLGVIDVSETQPQIGKNTSKDLANDRSSPAQTTQHDVANKYLADRIAEISRTQSTESKMKGFSLLKYALSQGKRELAIKMSQHRFTLNKNELPDPKNRQTILESNRLISTAFKLLSGQDILTKNDKKRIEIIGNIKNEDLEEKKIDLSTKPSPLYIAIETGQLKLAAEMLEQGFTLKQSEINKYAKDKNSKLEKQGMLSQLGLRKRKRSFELIRTKIEEVNDRILPPDTPRKIKEPDSRHP